LQTESFSRLLKSLLISSALFASLAHAAPTRDCDAKDLDVDVVLPRNRAPEPALGWLALDVTNRSGNACFLREFVAAMGHDRKNEIFDRNAGIPDPSPAAKLFREKGSTLEPNDSAHVLLVWSNRPQRYRQFSFDDCAMHESINIGWNSNSPEFFLELRHLRSPICGSLWQSSRRAGPATKIADIPNDWLKRNNLSASDAELPIPRAQLDPSVVSLSLLNSVEYLKGTFDSGYFGYFELYLKNATSGGSCPFSQIRKRESDGKAVVYVNECGASTPTASAQDPAGQRRIVLRSLGLLPESAGKVEYRVLIDDSTRRGPLRADISMPVRDPQQPMLPVIETAVPVCKTSQLRLSAQTELGEHWREPLKHAPTGERWYDGKAFEVTNVSDQKCLIGGIPRLKFLNAKADTTGWINAPLCRECSTPFSKPRFEGWIDLPPSAKAHFIAVRKVLDADHFFTCTAMGGFELLTEGETHGLRLPFEAGFCGSVAITNWRSGSYSKDEGRLRTARQSPPDSSAPAECKKEISKDTGTPTFVANNGQLHWGVSSKSVEYGEPVNTVLWVYNSAEIPASVMTCSDIDWFWSALQVFDNNGHRVLSRQEQEHPSSGSFERIFICSRNFAIPVPPRACIHGQFSDLGDFSRDLRSTFVLPPGLYWLRPSVSKSADQQVLIEIQQE
jgi:hypothetical protein